MRKSKHLPGFILILTLIGILGAPFSLSELAAQDRIPACPPPGKKQKTIKPLREMNWANDTVSVQFFSLPLSAEWEEMRLSTALLY